jgi:hypothetical protein
MFGGNHQCPYLRQSHVADDLHCTEFKRKNSILDYSLKGCLMTTLPYLVQSAHYIVDQFLCDWQRDPYRWDYERDVLIGQDALEGYYPAYVIPGYDVPQRWARVAGEATIPYRYRDGTTYLCRPDIVMWDAIPDPYNPPPEEQWPILWACEIKYHAEEPGEWDVEKLDYLITQGKVQYGCWLTMLRSVALTGKGITWQPAAQNAHIWLCKAQLPARR